MSITAYGQGAFRASSADQTFRSLKSTLTDLQTQLTTGKKAQGYLGLGAATRQSLSSRQILATLEAHTTNIGDANLRVKIMSNGIQQIGKIGQSIASTLPGSYLQTPIGQTSAIVSAEDGMRQIIDVLNADVNGRYLYSGRTPETRPVAYYEEIMDGDATRVGLKDIVAERKAADLGVMPNLGRVVVSTTPMDTTITEQASGPFGMKIGSATATGTGLTATTSALPTPSATLGVATQPEAGDSITLDLTMPDGSTKTLTFTARLDAQDANSFTIGATAADTAAALQTVVGNAIKKTAETTLASASSIVASNAFFAGSASNPPMRVDGPPGTATALIAGTASNTVIWYKGDDASGSARETAPVRVSDNLSVGIGARANEQGFQEVLSALGALAADSFPPADTTSQDRYSALADDIAELLGPSTAIRDISIGFSTANKDLAEASKRIGAAKVQAEDILAGAEDADPNEVATKLLATQTRLQASYQVTSTINKMSLVNFI